MNSCFLALLLCTVVDPDTGLKYGATFPQLTPTDMVAAHKLVLDHLGRFKISIALKFNLSALGRLRSGFKHGLMGYFGNLEIELLNYLRFQF